MSLQDYETVQEAAERLGIDTSQVRRYCVQGRIPGAIKLNPRMWMVPKGAVPTTTGLGRPPTWRGQNPES